MKEYLRKVRRRSEVRELFSRKTSCRERERCTNRESWKTVKFFNSGNPLFIGLGRGSSAKRASIQPSLVSRATRVPSDVPRVTFFTKFPKDSWNRIVGVNPLPQGASVGEFRKTRHPRNVEFNKVLEACFLGAGNSRLSESWNL
jgi:hypothetical protein